MKIALTIFTLFLIAQVMRTGNILLAAATVIALFLIAGVVCKRPPRSTVLLLLLIPFAGISQEVNLKLHKVKHGYYVTQAKKISLAYASGALNGTGEILRNKYHKFTAVHPNANAQFWNPLQSHANKWKDGHISNGEKFFLSSTALVALTDGYHLLRTFEKNFMVAAVVINFVDRKPWYIYLLEFVLNSGAWSVGFHTTYSLLYKGMKP